MKLKSIILFILALFFVNCSNKGKTNTTATTAPATPLNSFAYTNQHEVLLHIDSNETIQGEQRQILIYQDQREKLIRSSVIAKDGHLDQTLVLANHLDSIWITIPSLNIDSRAYIVDDTIELHLGAS